MVGVLDEPFVFTQRPALTVETLRRELRERRVGGWPDSSQLEAFHRAGLLVPIYSIVCDAKLIRDRARAEGRQLTPHDIRGAVDHRRYQRLQLIEERR